ncbi:hypothetical protein L2E82_45764 [Cichorium intybus]|uniref:Uncharacterized protein n=1 Tax=Cichorium intybus TaxID=13427 RepID=A0ACB8ZTU9_CICIN|nr:hypothetical protein L2E82_45764 [Cichorium intybus]
MGSGFLLSRHQIPSSSTSGTFFRYGAMTGVLINKVSISSPKLSPNTDGIHIENTKSVSIYNLMIGNEVCPVDIIGQTNKSFKFNFDMNMLDFEHQYTSLLMHVIRPAAENMEVVAVVQKYGEGN